MSNQVFLFLHHYRLRLRHTLNTVTVIGSLTASFLLTPLDTACAKKQSTQSDTSTSNAKDTPVTFQSDTLHYNNTKHIITWLGNVQVWQSDHFLRADKIIYNRDTRIMAAHHNIVSVLPDGSSLYARYAELTDDMKNGIMVHVNAAMANNAQFAANGLRRTAGKINDLSRMVYTACEICKEKKTPFWQIRAFHATQDLEHKQIDFRSAYFDILGVPVLYLPYFSITDPSAKRHSGFLIPKIGPHDRYLGSYFTIPYYRVIDDHSDVILQGLFSTRTAPQLSAKYRNRFNFGTLNVQGGFAYNTHRPYDYINGFGEHINAGTSHGLGGYIFINGRFSVSKHWRAGINARATSSANYMRDYRIPGYGADALRSNAYLEGFGTGAYSRLELQMYQGLNHGIIHTDHLPMSLPRYTYNFLSQPDALGGRLSVLTTDFDLYRIDGVRDQRGQLALNWDRPWLAKSGQQFLLTLRLNSMIYHAIHAEKAPDFFRTSDVVSGQVLPTIALKTNWPLIRTFAHNHGTQILEPIVQAIYAPNSGMGQNSNLPNEDSFAYQFTDSTLFSLNRYQGTDRLDGGLRANIGVHANWTWKGHVIDILAGNSFQEHIQHNRLPYSGLSHHISDFVARARVTPNQYIDFTARTRLSPYTGAVHFADALFSAGVPHFHLRGGYIYQPVTPYYYYATNTYPIGSPYNLYLQPTNELSGGVAVDWDHWHVSAFTRRRLSEESFTTIGGNFGYNNDCFGINFMYLKQYSYIGGQRRNASYFITISLKTLGSFGRK